MTTTRNGQNLTSAMENISRGIREGVAHLRTENERLEGRTIQVQGRELVHFGSCSYLGLEMDTRLKVASAEAIGRYGTQFSSSRTFMELGLYEEYEALLSRMFGAPALVTPTTTLGHLAAVPLVVKDSDAVIMDHQAHASLGMAIQLLRARGVHIELIRHSRLDMLENRLNKLQNKYRKIWYFGDGVYSMYGDLAPLPGLMRLLEAYDNLWLYMDDAHGISWTGPYGSGYVNSWLSGHPRVIMTASLNKSFAAGGGAIIFPNQEMKQEVRTLGSTLIFGGPLQPAMLGAGMASARVHLSPELPVMQAELQQRLKWMRHYATEMGVPLYPNLSSPIAFVEVGAHEGGFQLMHRLMEAGYFVNLSVFPSVPRLRTGMRLTLTRHLQQADIVGVLAVIAEALPQILKAGGTSVEAVQAEFAKDQTPAPEPVAPAEAVLAIPDAA